MSAAILALCAALAWAAPVGQPDADAAFDAHDYAKAARLFSDCAERGDAYCQFRLGALYYTGSGVPRDLAKSQQLLEASAAQGFSRAALRLGRQLIFTGKPDEGMAWLRKAADAGNADAGNLLEIQKRLGPVAPADPSGRIPSSYQLNSFERALDRGGIRWVIALGLASLAAIFGVVIYGVIRLRRPQPPPA